MSVSVFVSVSVPWNSSFIAPVAAAMRLMISVELLQFSVETNRRLAMISIRPLLIAVQRSLS